jgi:hypothetical protein
MSIHGHEIFYTSIRIRSAGRHNAKVKFVRRQHMATLCRSEALLEEAFVVFG